MRAIKHYPIESSPLFKLRSKRRLEKILKLPHNFLQHVDSKIVYYPTTIKKKDGSPRQLWVPCDSLKAIQKRLLTLLQRIELPEWIVSGKKGSCYIDNAKIHVASKFIMTMDISSFYDNCLPRNIYSFFRDQFCMSSDIAGIITKLVTYNNCLPTGSPSSQILSFWSYRRMFSEIFDCASQNGMLFSLYVDDMTFSCNYAIHDSFSYDVTCLLRKHGHNAKQKKTRFYGPNDFKMVTGVIITPDGKLDVPNRLRHKIVLDALERGKIKSTFTDKEYASFRGRIMAARNIKHTLFPELSKKIRSDFSLRS